MTVYRLPIEQIKSARVHAGFAYWKSILHGKELPARVDFDPAAVPRLLPHVILSEVHYDPLRVRYRLVGTRICEVKGSDLSGRWMEEDPWAFDLDDWYEDYRIVTQSRLPLFGRDDMVDGAGTRISFEWGILPLSSDGQTVEMALEVIDYENEPKLIRQLLAERVPLKEAVETWLLS